MSRRHLTVSKLQKQATSLLLGIVMITAIPAVLAVTRFKVNAVDYDPASQTVSFKSTGPVNATVNSVNVGKNKRIILDIEDAEIGSIPRDLLLFQQLSHKWPAMKSITVNQFGGAHPVVRVLVDVDGLNYTAQIVQNRSQQLALKVQPTGGAVASSSTSGQPLLNGSGQVTSNNIQELKKAIAVLNDRYEQLNQDNQQLRTQLQQETQRNTISLKQQPADVQHVKDQNVALQSQVVKLKQEKEALLKRVTQTPSPQHAASPAATEVNRLKSELASSIEKNATLQSQNVQLNNQLQQQKSAVSKPSAPATQNASTATLQKQVAGLQQENAQLKNQLKPDSAKPQASAAPLGDPQLSGIKQQLEQAKSALNRSIVTINEQNKEISYLKRQVEQMQGVADANARDQLTALNAKLEQKDSEIRSLKEESSVLNEKLKTQSASNPNDATITALKADVQSKDALIAQLNTKIASSEVALQTAKATSSKPAFKQTASSASASAKESAELKRSLDEAKQENEKLQQTVATLSKQQTEIASNEKMLAEKVVTLQKEKEAALAGATAAAGGKEIPQVKALSTEVTTLKQDKAKLKAVNESLFAELTALKAKPQSKAPVNQQVATLNTKISTMESQLNDLMQDKKALSEEVDALKTKNTESEKALAEAKTAAANAVASAKATPAPVDANKDKKEKADKTDNSQVASMNQAMLKKQLTEAQAKLADSDARYRKTVLEYDRSQQKLKALMAANPKAAATASAADGQKTDQLASDNKRLQSQVDDLSKQLQVVRNKALELQKQVIKPESVALDATSSAKPAVGNTVQEAEKLFNQAHSLDENKQSAQALENYRKAAQLDPNNPLYVNAVAISLANQEQFSEAIRTLQDYIDNHSYNSDIFNTLGKIYLMSGQPDEAKGAFAKAVPMSALSNYGAALKKQGKLADAERVFKFALEMSPNDSEVLFNLGNIYNAQNNLQQAKDNYSQALSVNPSFAEAHYNLGLVYSKLGDKSNAAEHLEKFLELNPNASNAEVIKTYVKKLKG